jgi:peptide/nickel transport system permease protein
VVLILNFLLPHLTPGSFVETYAEQIASQHHLPYSTVLARLETVFGKPEPLPVAFVQYMKEILGFPPNFGPSFQYYPLPAWVLVLDALKWTLLLLGLSQIIAWGSSIFVGVYLALHKNRFLDKFLQPNFYFINSIPSFFLAQVAIFIFALGYPWKLLPVGGAYYIVPTLGGVLDYLLLPLAVVIVLSLPSHILVIRCKVSATEEL